MTQLCLTTYHFPSDHTHNGDDTLPRHNIYILLVRQYILDLYCLSQFWRPRGLRPLACYDCGFEYLRGHGCLSFVSVVCCHIEISVSGWSLVLRIPAECGVSECDLEASTMWRSWPNRGSNYLTLQVGTLHVFIGDPFSGTRIRAIDGIMSFLPSGSVTDVRWLRECLAEISGWRGRAWQVVNRHSGTSCVLG